MPEYKTPGVYINEQSIFPPSVAEVRSAVPAFIGYTETAKKDTAGDLHLVAQKISSLPEYELYYGKPAGALFEEIILDAANNIINNGLAKPSFLLYYSLQLYFDNGGQDCHIVSVGDYNAVIDKTDFIGGLGVLEKKDEPTLLLFPDAVNLPGNDLYEVQQIALQQAGVLTDRFCILDIKRADNSNSHAAVVSEFRNGIGTQHLNLKYGAAYTPHLKTTIAPLVFFRNWKELLRKNGVQVRLQDLTNDAAIQQKIATLEAAIAANDSLAEKQQEADLLNQFPLMKAIAMKLAQWPLLLPPSPAIAGVYCMVDSTRGVWKAPANTSLNNVNGLLYTISNDEQDRLNIDTNEGKSVNAIRHFTGKGFLVWGARTLAGNDNEWRYISVRRFFNMVEESVKKSTLWAVFEPNDANTWVRIQALIENYLVLKWREGALAGSKPEQAFYVNVGLGKTMTAADILQGRLIVEIGMAPIRPAEFIVLRYSMKVQQS